MSNPSTTPFGGALPRRALIAGSTAAIGAATAALAPTAAAAPLPTTSLRPYAGTELVLLGTSAGPPPEPGRVGISSVLHVNGRNYLIDVGRSAVTQYYDLGLRFTDLASVFITHLHADHIADYYNVFMLPGWGEADDGDLLDHTVSVYGPGSAGALPQPYGDVAVETVNVESPAPGLAETTRRLIDAYAYSSNLFMRDSGSPDPRSLVDVHEIVLPDVGASALGDTAPVMQPFTVMEDDRVKVSAVLVPHGPVFPAFAYRFDTEEHSVVFSGDTALTPNIITLAADADVLVHEAIDPDGFGGLPEAALNHVLESHTAVGDLGAVAEAAGVKRLVLSHLAPAAQNIVSSARWREKAQVGFSGEVIAGEDGMRIPLS